MVFCYAGSTSPRARLPPFSTPFLGFRMRARYGDVFRTRALRSPPRNTVVDDGVIVPFECRQASFLHGINETEEYPLGSRGYR